jgi:small subunit ribosomal protein S15
VQQKEIPMADMKASKVAVLKKYRRSELDTGSSEVQVALLTHRIQYLTDHFKQNRNDVHGRQGLIKMVNRRRKLLNYLLRTAPDRYKSLIKELELRK